MNCPVCNTNSYVKESRKIEKSIRRRRECPSCGTRFTTREYSQEDLRIIAEETKILRDFYEAHQGSRPKIERGPEGARFHQWRQPLERVFTGLKVNPN